MLKYLNDRRIVWYANLWDIALEHATKNGRNVGPINTKYNSIRMQRLDEEADATETGVYVIHRNHLEFFKSVPQVQQLHFYLIMFILFFYLGALALIFIFPIVGSIIMFAPLGMVNYAIFTLLYVDYRCPQHKAYLV